MKAAKRVFVVLLISLVVSVSGLAYAHWRFGGGLNLGCGKMGMGKSALQQLI